MAGTIIFALIGLFILLGKDAKTSASIEKRRKEAEERGAFLPTNSELNELFMKEAFDDWWGEKTMYPKEYIDYFLFDDAARFAYAIGIASKREIQAGYQPYMCIYYDKHTFDPFNRFNKSYKNAADEYNRTHNMQNIYDYYNI